MSDETAALKLTAVCPCAALGWAPAWARPKIEDGEIVCCRALMHFHVERGDEPPLCRISGDEVYRFTYEQASGERAWVHIGLRGHEVSVHRVYHPETFSYPERFEALLTVAHWQRLQDALAAANFWSLPAYVQSRGVGLDGYDITVEGRRGREFKATRLVHPDVAELRQIGQLAFDLAGLADLRI